MVDVMAELNRLYNTSERARSRDQRRSRKTDAFRQQLSGIGSRGSIGELSRVASEHRAVSGWSLDPDPENHLRIGKQHPGTAAVMLVHTALSDFNIPTPVNVRFAGLKRVKGHPPYYMDEGHVLVKAELQSLSSVKHHITVPVVVREGKMLYPGVLFHNERPRVMAQNTFDEILREGEVFVPIFDRKHLYSMPPDHAPEQRPKYPAVQTGLYGAHALNFRARQQKTASIRTALRGHKTASDHLDPAERPVSDSFGPGESVSLSRAVRVTDRGGVSYSLSSGTKGTVIRDMAGDNRHYYVDFPSEGFRAVIRASDLR